MGNPIPDRTAPLNLKNPTHKYDSAGTYTVKMVVMNQFRLSRILITKPTRVFEIPTAIFDHVLACSGKPTYFTDKSLIADTANIVNWLWNFGETTSGKDTSLLKDPVHQYKTDGDYLVRLIIKDQHGCFDTVDSTIKVYVTPVSSFTYTDNVNNMTGKLQFNNKSSQLVRILISGTLAMAKPRRMRIRLLPMLTMDHS